jgi:hypothetical protein
MGFLKYSYQSKCILLYNLLLCFFVVICLRFTTPNFEEEFFMWKIILSETQTFTKYYHHFNDVIVWQNVMQFLYAQFPSIPWFPLSLVSLSVISYFITVNILLIFAIKKKFSIPIITSMLIILQILYLPNILWLHHNRTSFLMAGSALLLFSFKDYLSQNKIIISIFAFAWFISALCLRPEAAAATLILFLIFNFLMIDDGIVIAFSKYSFFGIATFLFFTFYFYKINFGNEFYYNLEPDVEYNIVDNRNIIPLSFMKTKEDSAKYIAVAENWMLADIMQIKPEFIRSLISQNKEKHTADFDLLKLHLEKIFKLLQSNIGFALSLSIVIIYLLFAKQFRSIFGFILVIIIALLFISLSFIVNIYSRVVEPMLFLTSVYLFYLFFQKTSKQYTLRHDIFAYISIVVGCIVLFYYFIEYKQTSDSIKQKQQSIKNKLNTVFSEYATKRKYVVVMFDYTFLNTGAFIPFTGFDEKDIFFTEIGVFSGNKEFLKAGAEISKCELYNFECKMKFLAKNKNKLIIFSKEKRQDLYNHYLKCIYNLDWNMKTGEKILLQDDSYIWLPE